MLGDISGKYESGNRAGAVSTGIGDLGGVSYGAHQFIAPAAESFVRWLKEKGHPLGRRLSQHPAGTSDFGALWKQTAQEDHDAFLALQHEYTKMEYYDPAVKLLEKENFHTDKHSTAVKEMVFSRAVQYGPAWAAELFAKGMKFANPSYLNLSYIDEERFDGELIRGVYDFLICCCDTAIYNGSVYVDKERWTCGSYEVVKIGLRTRFLREKDDLLAMWGGERH
jgi:hypothetical protein